MNPFKKSEIPDPVDTGKYAICNKVCSLEEADNFCDICLLMIARKKAPKVLNFKVALNTVYIIF